MLKKKQEASLLDEVFVFGGIAKEGNVEYRTIYSHDIKNMASMNSADCNFDGKYYIIIAIEMYKPYKLNKMYTDYTAILMGKHSRFMITFTKKNKVVWILIAFCSVAISYAFTGCRTCAMNMNRNMTRCFQGTNKHNLATIFNIIKHL